MAFDTDTRNKLAKMVANARSLLREEFTEQLQEIYGIQPDGKMAELDRLTHLDDEQRDHISCHPHRFAIETGDGWIKAELLVRPSGRVMNCECSGYCNDNQIKYVMGYVDTMISDLNIST